MQVASDVLAVLESATVQGNALILTGQLDRALYTKTNKVLEAAGGKWSRKAKAHVFEMPAEDRIDQIILTGSIEVPKDEFNYFPTPEKLAKATVALAGITPGMNVLEPSAGRGALAKEAAAAGGAVTCVELLPANFDVLMATPSLAVVMHGDFLTIEPSPVYDAVVMNPPFMKQSDIKHVDHALGFVKPGGQLVAIMSAGVTFRSDARTTRFRERIASMGGTITKNASGSFKSSATMVETVTVVVTVPA